MAGMLPGVECARRRRLHQVADMGCGAGAATSRKSTFCLYTSNHGSDYTCISSSLRKTHINKGCEDENLGGVAKQAKERLDEKLRTRSKSSPYRHELNKSLKGADESYKKSSWAKKAVRQLTQMDAPAYKVFKSAETKGRVA